MKTLYRGGDVFDGEVRLAGHDVLVAGDRVERLAPAAEFDGFAGEVVDISGGTLLPGLIDCHVHVCLGSEPDPSAAQDKLSPAELALRALERAQATLAGGVTAIRDCGGPGFTDLAVRDAVNEGRFAGPTMRAAGQAICMTGGHGNRMGRIADGPDEVVKAVREQVHAGADLVKLMATGGVMTPGVDPADAHFSADEMAAGIREAGRFRRRTASHAQGAEGILNAVRGGITSVEHGIFMNDDCIEEMLARGTYLVPTLSAVRNILENRDKGIPAWAVEKTERVYEVHKRAFRRFHEAGGRIAMGTDAGTPFNQHGDNAQELAYMVEGGMSAIDALRAATSIAADLVDLPERGRIRKGHMADFLIVEGDPLADIAQVARRANHRLVVKAGRSEGAGAVAVRGAPPRVAVAAGAA